MPNPFIPNNKDINQANLHASILNMPVLYVSDGSTAVHRACHDSNHEALQLLIEYKAELTVADVHGRFPIHWACTTKERECLRVNIVLLCCMLLSPRKKVTIHQVAAMLSSIHL